MSSSKFVKFKLPFDIKELIPERDNKVCVVSILGKSRHNVHQSKASMLNAVINKDLFQSSTLDEQDEVNRDKNLVDLEGHYDVENKLVLLHLTSCYDTTTMSDMCHRATEQINQVGYHSFLQSTEYQYVKAILYLFSISHILIIVHPGNSFDVTYIRLFRVLDTIRLKLQSYVTENLRGLGLSKDWVVSGRPCSPRVLFVFEMSTLTSKEICDPLVMSKTRSQKTPPIKRLQHAIEDQIYRILRKARVITNISNNSLFAVPANQEFVHVFSQRSEHEDPVAYYISQLQSNCLTAKDSDSPRSRSYQTNRRANNPPGGPQSSAGGGDSAGVTAKAAVVSGATSKDQNSFKEFLWQHIELAHSKGFDDNVGRNPVQAVFELPTVETWFEVCNKLHSFFLLDQPDTRSRSSFNTLKSLLEIDGRFSELRCSKIVPMAESAYREGLPQYYTSCYHQTKLQQAEQVFRQHARGPAAEKYLKQLAEECERVWCNGRRQCEEISLTGKPCVEQLHRVPEIPETESNAELPVLSHSSQVKTKAACNCGYKQAEREDSFDHRTANHDFYMKLETQCCSKCEHYPLPVFQPSTSNVKAGRPLAINVKDLEELDPGADISELLRKDSVNKLDIAHSMSGLSFALSLGQSGASDTFSHKAANSFNPEDAHGPVVMETDEEIDVPLSPLRQVSTTEYLPGMIHSDSPADLLPKFPSWSLLTLGKFSLYNPSQGLDQPGFLHGGNFLLPWDLTVQISDKEKWPTLGEMSNKKGKPRKIHKFDKDTNELSIRLYVGFEYECPRGHRYLLSAPDKIFKAPTNGSFKETAGKIVHNDMPLYYPCHCRSVKGYMGQLTRIFTTIPDGPFVVRLSPRVVPHPGHCPVFYPSPDGALTLTSGFWVLRFPYVYLGETGAYVMPTDTQAMAGCRVLKGMFTVTEST